MLSRGHGTFGPLGRNLLGLHTRLEKCHFTEHCFNVDDLDLLGGSIRDLFGDAGCACFIFWSLRWYHSSDSNRPYV